jgi:hypothetical protein
VSPRCEKRQKGLADLCSGTDHGDPPYNVW